MDDLHTIPTHFTSPLTQSTVSLTGEKRDATGAKSAAQNQIRMAVSPGWTWGSTAKRCQQLLVLPAKLAVWTLMYSLTHTQMKAKKLQHRPNRSESKTIQREGVSVTHCYICSLVHRRVSFSLSLPERSLISSVLVFVFPNYSCLHIRDKKHEQMLLGRGEKPERLLLWETSWNKFCARRANSTCFLLIKSITSGRNKKINSPTFDTLFCSKVSWLRSPVYWERPSDLRVDCVCKRQICWMSGTVTICTETSWDRVVDRMWVIDDHTTVVWCSGVSHCGGKETTVTAMGSPNQHQHHSQHRKRKLTAAVKNCPLMTQGCHPSLTVQIEGISVVVSDSDWSKWYHLWSEHFWVAVQ